MLVKPVRSPGKNAAIHHRAPSVVVRLQIGLDCRNFGNQAFRPCVRSAQAIIKGLFCTLPAHQLHHIENFRDYLTNHGVFTTIRASRGQDIFAACGLLSTAKKIEEERKRREQQ
jgi:hypothetical protein